MALRSQEEVSLATVFARTLRSVIALTTSEERRAWPDAAEVLRAHAGRRHGAGVVRPSAAVRDPPRDPRRECGPRHLPRRQARQPRPRHHLHPGAQGLVRADAAGRARGGARRGARARQAPALPQLRAPSCHRHPGVRRRARHHRRRARGHHRHRGPHQGDDVLGPGRHCVPVRGVRGAAGRLSVPRERLPPGRAAPPADAARRPGGRRPGQPPPAPRPPRARDARPAHRAAELPPAARARCVRAGARRAPRRARSPS